MSIKLILIRLLLVFCFGISVYYFVNSGNPMDFVDSASTISSGESEPNSVPSSEKLDTPIVSEPHCVPSPEKADSPIEPKSTTFWYKTILVGAGLGLIAKIVISNLDGDGSFIHLGGDGISDSDSEDDSDDSKKKSHSSASSDNEGETADLSASSDNEGETADLSASSDNEGETADLSASSESAVLNSKSPDSELLSPITPTTPITPPAETFPSLFANLKEHYGPSVLDVVDLSQLMRVLELNYKSLQILHDSFNFGHDSTQAGTAFILLLAAMSTLSRVDYNTWVKLAGNERSTALVEGFQRLNDVNVKFAKYFKQFLEEGEISGKPRQQTIENLLSSMEDLHGAVVPIYEAMKSVL